MKSVLNSKALSKKELSPQSKLIWRTVQLLLWLVGTTIVFCLLFFPRLGLHLFWDILIPVAPLLLVLAAGLWRNICPMASVSLFPRHMGFSKKLKLTDKQSGRLYLTSVILLFAIVPLRHLIFNTNGPATALLLLSLSAVAFTMGFLFEWKSGWCSSLCPIHPVEKLYGQTNKLVLPNAHCDSCFKCVTPCPDSTPSVTPLASKKTVCHRISGFLMVGAFPGLVWGWFQVPDTYGAITQEQLVAAYLFPLLGIVISSGLYLVLKQFVDSKKLIALFSAAAVSCYYWYRLPGLFGFGKFPSDGMLVDLTGFVPEWLITGSIITATLFFFWWIVFRPQKQISWVVRPAYATVNKNRKP